MGNLKRDNHYVPSCYQRNFADSSGKIWVKEAGKLKPEPRNPRKIGRQRSFYIRTQNGVETDNLETYFESIETPFAALLQRIDEEIDGFREISTPEMFALGGFVATQAVRTLAHKQCVDEQVGIEVNSDVFARVLLKDVWTIFESWTKRVPTFCFYTSLPNIGQHFITGDHPVVPIIDIDGAVFASYDTPTRSIISLRTILDNPKHGFLLALSPYMMVSVQGHSGGPALLPPKKLEPFEVKSFNDLIRGQCNLFLLAKDAGDIRN
jgi:hypothetical protein